MTQPNFCQNPPARWPAETPGTASESSLGLRVLLVDTGCRDVRHVVPGLQARGLQVSVLDGVGPTGSILTGPGLLYDAALVGLDHPGRLGWALLAAWRATPVAQVVVALTRCDVASHRVRALDEGSADCVTLPVQTDELAARLRALHRRATGRQPHAVNTQAAPCGAKRLPWAYTWPPRERQLLAALDAGGGRTVPKDELALCLRGADEVLSHEAIEVYVHRIRRRMAGSGACIRTVRGQGYRLVLEEGADART